MKLILVTSHRRSGTHFLIDTLRLNIKNAVFPNHRYLPSDFNLGSLFSKDQKILETFKYLTEKYPIVIIDLNFLKSNISNYLKFVNDFYRFNFSNEQMEQAVKQLDINRVSKLSSNNTIRISKEKIILSKEVKNYIIEKCQKEYLEISQALDHDLIKTL